MFRVKDLEDERVESLSSGSQSWIQTLHTKFTKLFVSGGSRENGTGETTKEALFDLCQQCSLMRNYLDRKEKKMAPEGIKLRQK